jgi:archaellum component FlaC
LVGERVVSCAAAIRELDDIWKKFKDVPNTPKARSRVSSYFKRACYPFQEQTLSKIQGRTSELRENLNLAVGILNAEIVADNKHTLTELQSGLGRTSQDTATISRRLDDFSQDIQRVNDNVSTVGTGLQLTELSIRNRLDKLPSDTAVVLRNDLLLVSDRINTQISTLLDQSARQQQEQFKAMVS